MKNMIFAALLAFAVVACFADDASAFGKRGGRRATTCPPPCHVTYCCPPPPCHPVVVPCCPVVECCPVVVCCPPTPVDGDKMFEDKDKDTGEKKSIEKTDDLP